VQQSGPLSRKRAFEWRVSHSALRLKEITAKPLLVAVAYFAGAEIAFLIGTLSDRIFAPFWPPNVILFCALLVAPNRQWWRYIVAAFPAHALAELQVGMPAVQLTSAFATNCLLASMNAAILRRILGELPWPNKLRTASYYVLITVVANPAACALGGAFVPILGGEDIENYPTFWAQWYLANALGSLTLGPLFLLWLSGSLNSVWLARPRRRAEALALGMTLTTICIVIFGLGAGTITTSFIAALLYSPLPLILWAAVRFGKKGASAAILVVVIVLLSSSLNGSSLLMTDDSETNVFALQIFLIGLAIPVLLLGASIDQLRAAEQATRESEARMGFAAASANIGLWYFEPIIDRLWATDHCRSMLGILPSAPLTPVTIHHVVHPDDRGATKEWMRSVCAGEGTTAEFRIALPNGQIRWLHAKTHADLDDHGKPFRVSGVFSDVTARKAAEHTADMQRRELAHLMRVSVMGELSGAIAHELNQPLTAILSNAQAVRLMLSEKPLDLVEIGEAIDDVVHEGKRAGEVIDRLFGLLRKGEGKWEPVNLNGLVASTLQLLHSELIGRRITVVSNLADDLPFVGGDAVQLQQVLLNLIVNATDAMISTPVPQHIITITTRMTDRIEVTISDRGCGLGPEEQSRVFEPFFTTKLHGLGLGLSICSTIIKSHGGELKLANNPDGGARATFTLPRQRVVMEVR
jgi:signal transduction histidine kinase/integral membrane sensor domain MASE1